MGSIFRLSKDYGPTTEFFALDKAVGLVNSHDACKQNFDIPLPFQNQI